MPAYLTMAHLVAEVPPQFVTEALDDNGDGSADAGLFDQIVSNVQAEIDGLLGQKYTVPFSNPIPAVVVDAAIKLTGEKLYTRRGLEGDKNPFAKRAAEVRALLKKIGAGEAALFATAKPARPAATAITEPAKTAGKKTAL